MGSMFPILVCGASWVDAPAAATLVAITLNPGGPPLISPLLWGRGRPWRGADKLCLLFPITWQRIWKVVEAGNPVTKLPLEES